MANTQFRGISLPQSNTIYSENMTCRKCSYSSQPDIFNVVTDVIAENSTDIGLIETLRASHPQDVPLLHRYGVMLRTAERYEESWNTFEKILAIQPQDVEALFQLGVLAMHLRQPESVAEGFWLSTLRYQPNHEETLWNLGSLYLHQERFREAMSMTEPLAARYPEQPQVQHRLAILYGNCNKIPQAKTCFQKASSQPGGSSVWHWKHLGYSPIFFETESEMDDYWQQLHEDLDTTISEHSVYDWKTLAYEGFTYPFNLPHYHRCCREVFEKYANLFKPSFPFDKPAWRPHDRIRVGFLVTPGHEGGFVRTTAGIIDQLDSEKFEVELFYHQDSEPKLNGIRRNDLIRCPYDWKFESTVSMIRATQTDVLCYWKVAADTWSFFLPMAQLAPVQCTSWGTHGTSGVSAVDYYLSDRDTEPENAQEHYTEKLYLLDTKPTFEPMMPPCTPATRSELGLPENGAIYFCPHRLQKYHPIFDLYLKGVLEHDPVGTIVMLTGYDSVIRQKLRDRMERNIGKKLMRRVFMIPHQSVNRYYQFLSVSTAVLDSPVYSGCLTALDAFSFGVPCVVQSGDWLVQRYSSALYRCMNLSEMVSEDRESWVSCAVQLGTDPSFRREISERIVRDSHNIFENHATILEYEHFFEMASRHPEVHSG